MPLVAPILMYHSVGDAELPHAIDAREFGRQMEWLDRHGFSGVSLQGFLAARGQQPRPSRPVVLTFDDGYADFAEVAVPTLAKFGFTATVFVVSSFVNSGETPWSHASLSWSDCRRLCQDGFEVGSHTISHPDLRSLSEEQQSREIRESKETIEQNLGSPVQSFAYPFGYFDQRSIELVKAAGYDRACAVRLARGIAENDYLLQRIGITRHDTLLRFKIKMSSLYGKLIDARLAWIPSFLGR